MRTLNSTAVTALSQAEVRLVQLVLMEFSTGVMALNTSTWDLVWSGVTYKGAYGIGTISAIDDSPGEVKGLSFEMSGVSSAAISLALYATDVVQGTPVTIRTAVLGADYTIADAPIEWTGLMDTMTLSESGASSRISVTAESSAVDLLRGSPSTYSEATQQQLYPGDRAFEYVVSQVDAPVVWPSKEWFKK